MEIKIYTMLFEYQKRYFWQLSSIANQVPYKGNPVPNIVAHADVSLRDRYCGWNDWMFSKFSKGSQENWYHTQKCWKSTEKEEDDPFGRRGLIRNSNLKDALSTQVDWILFNDGDMVYHPEFFAHLATLVAGKEDEQKVFASGRYTMSFEDGYRLVDSVSYDALIENPVDRILDTVSISKSFGGRVSGAGFFQLVSMKALKELCKKNEEYSFYVPSNYKKDNNTFLQNHITRSDRTFRTRLGGIVPIKCMPQYHINHYRKSDKNYDFDLQH